MIPDIFRLYDGMFELLEDTDDFYSTVVVATNPTNALLL